MKINKQEQKYRAKQQLACKFKQKGPLITGNFQFPYQEVEEHDKKAVSKLVDKLCK